MRKAKKVSYIILMIGILMISTGMMINKNSKDNYLNLSQIEEIDIKNLSANTKAIFKEETNNKSESNDNLLLESIEMETAPASVIIPPRIEVYGGMTLEEVAAQINKSLKNDITNKGMVIASKCIELGVDPFIASAIILHETGCGQNQCSNIARNCYNFGGQKGSGCGAYQRYNSVDEGLAGMISNLYRNYYARGLTTVETIGPRYAESNTWVSKINWYVNKLKNA